MHEIGRGVRAFEAPPVLGTFVVLTGEAGAGPPEGAPVAGTVIALVADHALASLPAVEGDLVAVVCTTGDQDAPLAALGREQQVPCVLGASFDGAPPAAGSLVMVDCSSDGAVVDGGAGGG